MITEKYLSYRGDIRALCGVEKTLFFTTVHEEQQPTALYCLNGTDLTLTAFDLKCGAQALCTDGKTLWIAGSNKCLYQTPIHKPRITALTSALAKPATVLVRLSENRLAALIDEAVAILSCDDGRLLQTLSLSQYRHRARCPCQW